MVDNAEFRNRVPEEDAGHTCIPNAVLLDARIAPMTRLCYSVIKSYAYGDKRDARPGQKTLAQQLGVKDRMVRNYLTELEILGLLTIEQRGMGKTNIYWIEPLAGLEERIVKYQEWQRQKTAKRQPIATQDRQPITAPDRQPIADQIGNPLPMNKTSNTQNKTRKNKHSPEFYVIRGSGTSKVAYGPAPSQAAAKRMASEDGTMTNAPPSDARILPWIEEIRPRDLVSNAIAHGAYNKRKGTAWTGIQANGIIAEQFGDDKPTADQLKALSVEIGEMYEEWPRRHPGLNKPAKQETIWKALVEYREEQSGGTGRTILDGDDPERRAATGPDEYFRRRGDMSALRR